MSKFGSRWGSPLIIDLGFAAMGIASLAALSLLAGRGVPAVAAAEQPLRVALSLLAVLVVATAVGTTSSRLDQAKDEYVYRLLTRSALIAMIALVTATTFWSVGFEDNLGELSGTLVLTLSLGAWSLGYLYARIKGTSE
jgi:hypothetical protein